jgi:hypothetical protein
MNSPDQNERTYRMLSACAILHALIVTAWVILSWPAFPWNGEWDSGPRQPNLWVAFTTLWLFWPVALLLHCGRSVRVTLVALLASAVILYPSFREYNSDAPRMFGLPEGIETFSPFVIWEYFIGYSAGRSDANHDLCSGRIVHEEIGMPKPAEYYSRLRQVGLELRSYGDVVTTKMIAHVKGYNEVMEPAITQKFGGNIISAAADEAWRKEAERQKNQ